MSELPGAGLVRRWRAGFYAVAVLTLGVVGARIGLPGANTQVVDAYMRAGATNLVRLYDLLAGGTVSRAAILALGALPYLAAKTYIWAARSVSPAVSRLTETENGRRKLRAWTRVLTAGLAVIQSYGYARFLQSIPGAVAHPGAGFIGQTVLLLTGGSLVVGWLGERITSANDDDAVDDRSCDTMGASPALPSAGSDDALMGTGSFEAHAHSKEERVPRHDRR